MHLTKIGFCVKITIYTNVRGGIMDSLIKRFPPSVGCSCEICKSYCKRPGWWTVDQAAAAVQKGYAYRMMMEVSPALDFAVLSPAFYGCESFIATQEASLNGCNFLKNGLCELHKSGLLPIECAFCHHDRIGQGIICHNAIAEDWKTVKGQKLVLRWQKKVGLERKINNMVKNVNNR